MDLVGKILGNNRYEILEKVGTGGMATVYEAKDRLLNRKVAIKVLKDEFSNDEEFINRFQVEAQAAASLSHHNIVSIYDVGKEEGLHYIVMELIKGKTLKEVITERGRLGWQEAAKIASQIASGLEQAHKNHIVHRDIKPHNIIITKDGVAKVTDFGIAKAVSASTINAYGTTVGSVHYFSPEHARGGYTDEKSDIYSLGVVLYEMVTGKLPFNADTAVSVALKHMQETPKEPIEIVSTIPQGLNSIIMKAMQKQASDRYSSASEMNSELQRILKTPEGSIETIINIGSGAASSQTQRIPIVGASNRVENREKYEVRDKENGDEDMGNKKKKSLTKKQAIIKLLIYILLAIALVFLTAKFTIKILDGTDSKPVNVPYLVGLHKDEASAELESRGLIMEVEAVVASSEYPKDFVIKQNYNEDYTLRPGSTVGVTLSKGAKTVFVPDVSTLPIEAAKVAIEQNGLIFAQEAEASDSVPKGEIVRQDPRTNTEVEVGSTVTVYVSSGVIDGMVAVPTVVNLTENEAKLRITTALLIPDVEYVKNESKPDGVVISQTPEANTQVSELSEVVIIVNDLGGNKVGSEGTETTNPTNPQTGDQTKPNQSGKTINIDLSNKGLRDTFTLRVEVQGGIQGKKILYEKTHSRKDGTAVVTIPAGTSGLLQVYVDDKLDSEMVIN